MSKKILGFVTGLLFCFLLAGCGDSGSTLILAGEDAGQMDSAPRDTPEEDTGAMSGLKAEDTDDAALTADEQERQPENAGVCVYICGEVQNPGVYVLAEGARLCDAVEAAGGMTESASRTYWNLARVLDDGEMIYVPTTEEAEQRGQTELYPSGENGGQEQSGGGISADGRVNINSATEEQLMTIPGIGEAKAKSIIAYREENGNFASIDDIVNVSGIKDGLFQQIKEYITVD